jgi:ATP-dependent DNA ligase
MEIVVLTAAGISDCGSLQDALLARGTRDHLVYYVFDLLQLNGKERLVALLATANMPQIRHSDHVVLAVL